MSQHSSTGASWKAIRQAVLDRDGHICVWCGREATEADHYPIPKSQGGRDTMDNLVASCKPCNASRQDKIAVRKAWWLPELLDGLW